MARLYIYICTHSTVPRKGERKKERKMLVPSSCLLFIADTWDYLQVRGLLAWRTAFGEFESASREEKMDLNEHNRSAC